MFLGPVHDAQPAVEILDQRRATLDPVAVVAVQDAVDVADLGMMNVTADNAIDTAPAAALPASLRPLPVSW